MILARKKVYDFIISNAYIILRSLVKYMIIAET